MAKPLDPVPPQRPFEPDFVDEGPGSYLAELGPQYAHVVWGVVSFAGTAGVGVAAWASKLDARSEWFTLARLVWRLLPVSALLLLLVMAWQLGTAYTKKPPSRVIPAVALALSSLALWCALAFGLGVLPGE